MSKAALRNFHVPPPDDLYEQLRALLMHHGSC